MNQKQRAGARDQGSEDPEPGAERMKEMLRDALPPVGDVTDVPRDLWPAMLRRLDAPATAPPWFDWVLAGGLVVFAAFVPVSIPVLLYYL